MLLLGLEASLMCVLVSDFLIRTGCSKSVWYGATLFAYQLAEEMSNDNFHTRQQQVRFPHISRPMILNGIPKFITAPDLLDRSIVIHLGSVSNRRTESDLWRDFNSKRSRIFGGLLDLMVEGVRNLPNVRLATRLEWRIS